MYGVREKFGEPNVFLEIGPTKGLTQMRASFSLRVGLERDRPAFEGCLVERDEASVAAIRSGDQHL